MEVVKNIGAEFVVNLTLPLLTEDQLAAVVEVAVAFNASSGSTLTRIVLKAFDTWHPRHRKILLLEVVRFRLRRCSTHFRCLFRRF